MSSPSPALSPTPPPSLSEIHNVIARWKSSGLGQVEWCRAQGMKRSTLAWYVKRVRLATPHGFIALRQRAVESAPSPTLGDRELILELGRGMRVSGLQIAEVVVLARALAEVAS